MLLLFSRAINSLGLGFTPQWCCMSRPRHVLICLNFVFFLAKEGSGKTLEELAMVSF